MVSITSLLYWTHNNTTDMNASKCLITMSDILFATKYTTCLLYTRFVFRDKENLENTKWVVRGRKSQKDRQYNVQNK